MASIPHESNRVYTRKTAVTKRRRIYDHAEIFRLSDSGLSQGAVSRQLGCNQAHISRLLKRRQQAASNGHSADPPTLPQRVEVVGEPVSVDNTPPVPIVRDSTADLKAEVDVLRAEVADLKAHRLEIDAWIATLQAQSHATQTRAEMRSAELRTIAQGSAEPAQIWDDPDDAKSVPFNLSLPRGLKRRLDAEAKRTGLPASRLVQRLLIAALSREGGRHE